ncbi:heavy-metal-associated domain-containing protein [Rhodothermus marinus]|uniref:heavy-metal-associated domain-containing protein n=1 Tax=Rhodothermus marinus TaxID=29549 RepID=UPI001FB54065|nr:heavy metal-associated domain-containing protein [Rhodothermus marinus]
MERRLQQLEGVDSVRVSLNEGRAWLWLHPDNRLTLQMIRQAIWDAGFAAREAVVRVQGELVSSQDSWLLHLPPDRYSGWPSRKKSSRNLAW